MNISTGGPHILLFERDQQLTALITSEFQLAGYECHAARTAVEVFDALARYPIRIVLVDLAQAAAARREFWVALDTQRRGRGVHVLTFHCSNLAGYGPQDPEDRSQNTIADLEIDGMLGLMKLVDEVRTRVPGVGNSSTTNTLPRMPKVTIPVPVPQSPAPSFTQPIAQRTGQNSPITTNTQFSSSGTSSRNPAAEAPLNINNMNATGNNFGAYLSPSSSPNNGVGTAPAQPAQPINGKTASYTDKIRAVLYPNQRNWSTQNNNTAPAQPEMRPAYETPNGNTPPQSPTAAYANTNEASMLQRLANGQTGTDNAGESGLAQLSRLARASYPTTSTAPSYPTTPAAPVAPSYLTTPTAPSYPTQSAAPSPQYENNTSNAYQTPNDITQAAGVPFMSSYRNMEQATGNTGPMNYAAPPVRTTPTTPAPQMRTAPAAPVAPTGPVRTAPAAPAAPAPTTQQVRGNGSIGTQPLRASPIQDIPIDRPGQAGFEGGKRPDVLSRANYGQQQPAPTVIQQPLASISTPTQPPAQAPVSTQAATAPTPFTAPAPPMAPVIPATPRMPAPPSVEQVRRDRKENPPERETIKEPVSNEPEEHRPSVEIEYREQQKLDLDNEEREDSRTAQNNALLFDIMQSLPPMPPLVPQPQQQVQPQVLSGRATRSLGSVLLAGHLVPQNRLEAAQNIQRMLRGVDLNYHLGEILLMFKLLTPDQLLAASLVSYGLITTTQISALGRIRQELHSMGLEYDLESLLILFRILTPEQLREVKNSWPG